MGEVRITGKYAAATTTSTYKSTVGVSVTVRNLRTGKLRWAWTDFTDPNSDTVLLCCPSDLELKRSGAVGWMTTAYDAQDSPPFEPISRVMKLDATTGAQGVMLDNGPEVRSRVAGPL